MIARLRDGARGDGGERWLRFGVDVCPLQGGRALLRLCMADLVVRKLLGGLYMAPDRRNREYGRCDPKPHTRHIPVSVPYISHLAAEESPNLPYISEISRFAAVLPPFRGERAGDGTG